MGKKILNKKGFTLVELIVSLGLLSVVIALTCAILLSVFNHYSKDATMTEAQEIGDTASQWLTDQLRYATELEISDKAAVNTYNTAVQVKEGNLCYWRTDDTSNVENLYGEQFYYGMSINTEAYIKDGRWLTIITYVDDREGQNLYKKERTFEIINMSLAQKESELRPDGTAPENTIKVMVSGNLQPDATWTNPIFCFSSDLTVSRDDFYPPPTAMYNQCLDAAEILRNNPELNKEYNDNGSQYLYNEGIRNYVRLNYYDGRWPEVTYYLDLEAISQPTGDQYRKPLNGRNIVIQPHITTKERNGIYDFVVIFGRDYGNGDPNANSWNNYVLVFVPYNYSQTYVDMSAGQWYTFLPTTDHPEWYNYDKLDGLTGNNSNPQTFFDNVKKNWHPIDGKGCVCQYCHPGGTEN